MSSKNFYSNPLNFKLERINNENKDDDDIYLKQHENKPYEFLNSFDLIYSEISNRIKNALNEKLSEIESSQESQEKEIMSLMNVAYDCKRELDMMLNDAINTLDKHVNGDDKDHTLEKNLLVSKPEILNPINTQSINLKKSPTPSKIFTYSTEKNSKEKISIQLKDSDSSGQCRVSVIDNIDSNIQTNSEKKSENNIVSYNINNNYYKSFFHNSQVQSQSQSISSRDKNSRQNSFNNNKKILQPNNLMNSINIDTNNNLLNIIQSIKKNKSKMSLNSTNNNPKEEENEIKSKNKNENFPFSFKKRKPPSDGNFSNSNTTTNSKQTSNNSDKVENLFLKMNSNKNLNTNANVKSKIQITRQNDKNEINEKISKIEKITNQLRGSYTPNVHKELKIEKKPTKIIKKLFFDKKSINISGEDAKNVEKNETNINRQYYTNVGNNSNKELDLIEHIQIDLFGSSTNFKNEKNISSKNLKQFFTNEKNQNIILSLFDYCKTNSEKIRIKNISKLTRLKFYEYEINNLENLIEYKKRLKNPLSRLEITNKVVFSKKLTLSDIFETDQNHLGFRNFIILNYLVLINPKSISISVSEVSSKILKNMIDEIQSYLNRDLNIYSKYKEIIKNLKSNPEFYHNLKDLKKQTNGNFLCDLNQFLVDSFKTNADIDIDVFLELSESIDKLLEEDTKINFDFVIDIEILNHRKEILTYYKDNLNSNN